MLSALFSCHVRQIALALALTAMAAAESRAIEMFTYFGDGSRIGLPSLEVPIEAYPGIPLRSDRLRARRRAMRMGQAAVAPPGTQGPSRTITIRAMPQPLEAPIASPSPATTSQSRRSVQAAAEEIPVAPAPEEVATPPQP